MAKRLPFGRLALRVEGDNWVGYYTVSGAIVDAVFLGSIRMSAVQKPERKEAFIMLMRDVVADVIEEITGHRPEWNEPTAASESERSGSA